MKEKDLDNLLNKILHKNRYTISMKDILNFINNQNKEIERLNKELDYYKREKELYRYYQQEVPRLSNIINKAIDYISDGIYSDYGERSSNASNELLNILRGEDDK